MKPQGIIHLVEVLIILTSVYGLHCSSFRHAVIKRRDYKRNGFRIRPANIPTSAIMSSATKTWMRKKACVCCYGGHRRDFLITIAALLSTKLVAGEVESSMALEPAEASFSYDQYASSYDTLDGGPIASFLELDKAREQLLSNTRGHVLEIGAGTGLNMNFYPTQSNETSSSISSIVFLDISGGMLEKAKERASNLKQTGKLPMNLSFVQADATSMSQMVNLFGTNSFDTIVDTFSLCVLGNEGALNSLKTMRELLKKDGGRIMLLENSRAENPLLGWYQDRTAAVAASWGGKGCIYNQNVYSLIQEAGLSVEHETSYMGGLFRAFICTMR